MGGVWGEVSWRLSTGGAGGERALPLFGTCSLGGGWSSDPVPLGAQRLALPSLLNPQFLLSFAPAPRYREQGLRPQEAEDKPQRGEETWAKSNSGRRRARVDSQVRLLAGPPLSTDLPLHTAVLGESGLGTTSPGF